MSDNRNGAGFLEVGTNEQHEVIVNLPRDMTGHIVFSVDQARALADILNQQAGDAARAKYEADAARARADAPPVDRSKQCTTNGRPVDEVRARQTNKTGQHEGYIVLCAEERAKGFVRPYRDAYKHVGPAICGHTVLGSSGDMVCFMDPGHAGDCGVSTGPRPRVCGTVTTMGRALSETYARDPTFYGATFCCGCDRHLPVAEFVWTADGTRVGS